MQVSFNPVVQSYKNTSFMARKKANEEQMSYLSTPTKDELINSKTKKAVSECAVVVLGIAILYFAMKRNVKFNTMRNESLKIEELGKKAVPEEKLTKVLQEFAQRLTY